MYNLYNQLDYTWKCNSPSVWNSHGYFNGHGKFLGTVNHPLNRYQRLQVVHNWSTTKKIQILKAAFWSISWKSPLRAFKKPQNPEMIRNVAHLALKIMGKTGKPLHLVWFETSNFPVRCTPCIGGEILHFQVRPNIRFSCHLHRHRHRHRHNWHIHLHMHTCLFTFTYINITIYIYTII